jgi:hypothetical protein
MPFVKGDPRINREGRPKGSGGGLKDYDRRRFQEMRDEEKEAFLAKVSPIDRYKMAEGNPKQDVDVDGEITTKIISIDE